ncbi:MAG: PAS domain S-box protein [Saprospiraceae bacterium]|nr:PAS domain S-box protein [Candidatus Brachybacter algidus]
MNPVPMWTVDVESLRYIDVNTAAIKHYGYTREEFLSMRATEIRPPEELQKYLDHVKNTNDQEHYSGVWKHQKKMVQLSLLKFTTIQLNSIIEESEMFLLLMSLKKLLLSENY